MTEYDIYKLGCIKLGHRPIGKLHFHFAHAHLIHKRDTFKIMLFDNKVNERRIYKLAYWLQNNKIDMAIAIGKKIAGDNLVAANPYRNNYGDIDGGMGCREPRAPIPPHKDGSAGKELIAAGHPMDYTFRDWA